MRIAIASGKGGTGKTTIATNLAVALASIGNRASYVDCDVEEPNGHLFLRPRIVTQRPVTIPVPEVDETRCNHCGACGAACRFSAIVTLDAQVLTFQELCHGCGGCSLACPVGAVREVPRVTGVVEEGVAGPLGFYSGRLNVGDAMAPPVIRAVLKAASPDRTLVIDAPPGTGCAAVESVRTADVALLVTEPTPFGVHDLELAVEMVRGLGVPCGVLVNRSTIGDRTVFEYCARERLPVLGEIPNDRAVAEAYSRGKLIFAAIPGMKARFVALVEKLASLSVQPGARVPEPRGPQTFDQEEEVPTTTHLRLGARHDTRELVVISGKGGTGKTSIASSFFALADEAVASDCDVDASNLHLVLDPEVRHQHAFSGGSTAILNAEACNGCGRCEGLCRFDAIRPLEPGAWVREILSSSCEGCGVCVDHCPERAISLVPALGGQWSVADTRRGPLVHARLGIARENSGKLVSRVRREARSEALSARRELLIDDGSPGIGCPVIASIAGADLALIVAEPTVAGIHDLERIAELCQRSDVKAAVCINKADLNPGLSNRIEQEAASRGLPVLGSIRYDESVTAAQVVHRTIVEHDDDSPAARDVRALWSRVKAMLARGDEASEAPLPKLVPNNEPARGSVREN